MIVSQFQLLQEIKNYSKWYVMKMKGKLLFPYVKILVMYSHGIMKI